jgi:hypothetical protein
MDVEGSKEQMLNLTEQYELRKCLWNIMAKDNKNHKKGGWQKISFHV